MMPSATLPNEMTDSPLVTWLNALLTEEAKGVLMAETT